MTNNITELRRWSAEDLILMKKCPKCGLPEEPSAINSIGFYYYQCGSSESKNSDLFNQTVSCKNIVAKAALEAQNDRK